MGLKFQHNLPSKKINFEQTLIQNINKSSFFLYPMQEQVFLFVLALVWVTFASIHDLKKREVPNWLSYSLVIFGLSYRAFYALSVKQLSFFLYGLIGFAIFFALAYALYYGRVFAGGDAKLLMGMGVILPLGNTQEVLFNALFLLILLFLLGAAYSLIY
jgi:Flp pilus assembly protein protease CpaA